MTKFKNNHLSYSRLSRYEQCPLSYRLQYIDKLPSEPGVPLRFGKAVHAVLERLVREHCDEEREGRLHEDRALELWREEWEKNDLNGPEIFSDGTSILRSFVSRQGDIDSLDVLAIEKEFHLSVGTFPVLGFIDRVDRVDDHTVEIIDYKTNRQMFSRVEVDSSIQLSLYELAARKIWPWAKDVRLTFDMLRHGCRQTTSRTPEQLEEARAYVDTIGSQSEADETFTARLNSNCVWCDHKGHCPAYAGALSGARGVVCKDTSDLEQVAAEREEVASLAKIIAARKGELEGLIKAHLKHNDELIAGGMRYAIYDAKTLRYPLDPTLEILQRETGMKRDELVERVATVDKKALDQIVKENSATGAAAKMLVAELETVADVSHSSRFWAKKVQS